MKQSRTESQEERASVSSTVRQSRSTTANASMSGDDAVLDGYGDAQERIVTVEQCLD